MTSVKTKRSFCDFSSSAFSLFPGTTHKLSRSPLSGIRRKIYAIALTLLLTFLPFRLLALDSLSYKIGQMVMAGFYPGSDFEDTLYYDIAHRNLGGVILMAYNLDNPSQIRNLTSSLQSSADIPLLIATDQEGGVVARLDENNGFRKTERALTLGTLNNETTTRTQSALMAGWLASSGINTDLAPVADVNVNPSSPAIGYYGRSFSADPQVVSDHVYWFYDELKKEGIISSLKHFPGHGSAVGDSHDGFTDITDTWSEIELIPYTELINAGYNDMIMTAHLYNAKIDSAYPATLSQPTLTGILRDSLEFKGVIISDAMGMGAINNNYSFTESVVQAILAGVDILLYTGNDKYGKSVLKQINTVVHTAIDSGIISEGRIDESYDRIMELKSRVETEIADAQTILADTYSLRAYPNPFNPTTKISFSINDNLHETIQISIFSITGQLIQRKFVTLNGAGDYDVVWDARDLNSVIVSSGTYIYQTKINNKSLSGKMTLLK